MDMKKKKSVKKSPFPGVKMKEGVKSIHMEPGFTAIGSKTKGPKSMMLKETSSKKATPIAGTSGGGGKLRKKLFKKKGK